MDKKAVVGAILIAWAAALQVRHSQDSSLAILSLRLCARDVLFGCGGQLSEVGRHGLYP